VPVPFTFVLPVFESDVRYLVRQLDAISRQTSPLWRCVIVDDGSTNGEPARLARAWCSGEPRAEFVRLPSNVGIAAATNRAIESCRSEFVLFVDHDDVVSPDAIRMFAEYVRYRPEADVMYSDETLVDLDARTLFEYPKPDWSPERFLGQPYVNHLTAIRTELVRATGLRSEREPCQDYDLLHRVLPRARHVGHIATSLYRWRAIEGSTAKSATEKPNVATSVELTVRDAIIRAGDRATVYAHPRDPNGVIVRRAVLDRPDVTCIPIGDGDTSAINAAIQAIESGVVVLRDAGDQGAVGEDVLAADPHATAMVEEHGWFHPLVAQVQRAGVCVAGPMVLNDDRTIRSVGRRLERLADSFSGAPGDSTGPWATFLVAREVAAVAPSGWTVDVDIFKQLGGLRPTLALDVAVAEFSVRGSAMGLRTIWTPQCTLTTRAPAIESDLVPALSQLRASEPDAWTDRYPI
jgi:hypothetical protein